MMNARRLANQLANLLARERVAMADFLLALAEFDRRKAWFDLGHSSLFYFLRREFGLSAGAAYYRKTAAELLQKHPAIVEALRDGRLCLTSIAQLAKVLTAENFDEVVPRFFHQSKREAAFIAAELQPATGAPHRDVVTSAATPPSFVAKPDTAVLFHPGEMNQQAGSAGAPTDTRGSSSAPQARPSRPESAQPLTGELARLHITVSKRFLQKVDAARAALSHSAPGATTERILETGLDLILNRHAARRGIVQKPRNLQKKRQNGQRPRTRPSAPNSRAIPTAVKREVWRRDGGRCQWPLESGGICASTLRVEFDHSILRAFGGPATVENIRLLCRVHNDLAARRVFGDAWMNRFTRKRRSVAETQTTIGAPSG